MGCDIHPIIERLDVRRNEEGEAYWRRWVNAGTPDLGRNYELFSALAGVRNYLDIEPVAPPRGLPGVTGEYEDGSGFKGDWDEMACSEFEAYFRQWECDAHSTSWLTLTEIKAYDTTQIVDDPSIIIERDSTGRVLMTAGGTNHPGPHELVGKRRIFVWAGQETGEPTCWEQLIAEMERAKRDGDTDDDIRLVFFFDN